MQGQSLRVRASRRRTCQGPHAELAVTPADRRENLVRQTAGAMTKGTLLLTSAGYGELYHERVRVSFQGEAFSRPVVESLPGSLRGWNQLRLKGAKLLRACDFGELAGR